MVAGGVIDSFGEVQQFLLRLLHRPVERGQRFGVDVGDTCVALGERVVVGLFDVADDPTVVTLPSMLVGVQPDSFGGCRPTQ